MGRRGKRIVAALIALALTAAAGAAAGAPPAESVPSTPPRAPNASPYGEDFYTPRRHQLDLELYNMSDFVTDDSLIRRREASIGGSALHWGPDLGADTIQQPAFNATFWFDRLNALEFQFRYFALYGSKFLSAPVTFNGDVIAPGQNISASDSTWFTVRLLYERRITPWLETLNMPEFLRGWDVRPKAGLEFVYLDFKINGGHPALISGDLEARGRWHDQELPVPTIGLELRRRLGRDLALKLSMQGNWINKWNSLRSEGGTVYLSQASFEAHARLYYLNARLLGLRPFLGMAYYFYKQSEASGEIGNLARLQAFGPEFGLNLSFDGSRL